MLTDTSVSNEASTGAYELPSEYCGIRNDQDDHEYNYIQNGNIPGDATVLANEYINVEDQEPASITSKQLLCNSAQMMPYQ